MKKELKNEIGNAVKEWLSEEHSDHTQNKLQDSSGVNSRYIIAISQGEHTYCQTKKGKGDKEEMVTYDIPDKHYYKIAKAIGLSIEEEIHWEDDNYTKVIEACKLAQIGHRRVLIDSEESGDGKTYAAEKYAMTHDKCLYIKIEHNMKGYELINRIMKEMGIRLSSKVRPTNSAKLHRITEEMIARPNFLLILDEIEGRRPDLNPVIKDIEDASYKKCGFVLCGLGIIKEFRRGRELGRKYIPQLDRRFRANRVKLRRLFKSDINRICQENGIQNKQALAFLMKFIEDRAMLNEYILDIKNGIITKGMEVTETRLEALFPLLKKEVYE